MRRSRRVLLAAAILALAPPAAGQTSRRRRPPPAVQTAPAPGPSAPAAPDRSPSSAPSGLHSAVHGATQRPPGISRTLTGQCRARCAEARLSCQAAPTVGDCDGDWTRCLSACGGLAYTRAP